jgi:starvation-inducible DNA-binding protein
MPQPQSQQVASVLRPETQDEDLNIGLAADYREKMSVDLSAILAATYRLLIKSHLYHWNVVGPIFKSLHELTEAHYEALFEATDIIAERIRALGHRAPATLGDAHQFAPEAQDVDHTSAASMVSDLIVDHETAARQLRKAAVLADDNDDVVTTDMLTDRLTFHEKAIWMLRAIIAQ